MSSSYLESPVSALNRPNCTALKPFPQNLTCLLAKSGAIQGDSGLGSGIGLPGSSVPMVSSIDPSSEQAAYEAQSSRRCREATSGACR
jgi:hypothetical protein